MERRCESCGRVFVAQRSTARFCSDTCRKRALRGTPAPAVESVVELEADLVAATRERLQIAGLDGSVEGLLAVRLAEAVVKNEDGSKLAALAARFSAQMDRVEALAPRETSVDELRRRRDRKRARPA